MKQPERYVEPRLTQYLFDRASRTLTPLSGTFELSPVCNLACKMCYVRKDARRGCRLAAPARRADPVAVHRRAGARRRHALPAADRRRAVPVAGLLAALRAAEHDGLPHLHQLQRHPAGRGPRGPAGRASAHTHQHHALYGAGNETYEALCGRSGMFDRVDRAITLLRQAGILVKLNCSLTPHNACDLERIVSYAAERDLILEVNTYMFPPLRRDPAMIGRNDPLHPGGNGALSHGALPPAARRGGTSPAFCRTSCVASPAPRSGRGLRRPRRRHDLLPRGQRLVLGDVGRLADALRHDAEAAHRAEGQALPRGLERADARQRGPTSLRHLHRLPEPAHLPLLRRHGHGRDGSVSGIPKYLCEMVWAMRTEAARLLAERQKPTA